MQGVLNLTLHFLFGNFSDQKVSKNLIKGCLMGVWRVAGGCLKGVWKVSIGCPNSYLVSQDW